MLVYRYTSEEELKNILNGKKSAIGNCNDDVTMWGAFNNHKYRYGHKYLHFFKHKKSIKYLKLVMSGLENKKMFICTYDIPKSVLRDSKAKGIYRTKPKGEMLSIKLSLTEYAVEVEDFDCLWLVNIEQDKKTSGFQRFSGSSQMDYV